MAAILCLNWHGVSPRAPNYSTKQWETLKCSQTWPHAAKTQCKIEKRSGPMRPKCWHLGTIDYVIKIWYFSMVLNVSRFGTWFFTHTIAYMNIYEFCTIWLHVFKPLERPHVSWRDKMAAIKNEVVNFRKIGHKLTQTLNNLVARGSCVIFAYIYIPVYMRINHKWEKFIKM